jgi:GT2 family glycosyltransferase/2-polyprenyl-3-methyl-5-hydroxy-6-metoxy-1,4-benzoquinol methylase/tetratricopeptide (TPR) repeat protein
VKVGVVFDNRLRPETTGFYCLRALNRVIDAEHLLPHELNLIPAGLFDWFLLIDDGLDYPIPDVLRPRVAWVIDTHVDMERAVTRFGNSEAVFAAQRNGAAGLSHRLDKEVFWLPLACDPDFHRPVPGIAGTHQVAFVGNMIGTRRIQLLRALQNEFPSTVVGRSIFDEMAKIYSSARIGFNCSIADDLNMRLFEVPAHGIPLVTNRIDSNGLAELFDAGRHLLLYDTELELMNIIRELLGDETQRIRIAKEGREHVLDCHTYRHRMDHLLAVARTEFPLRRRRATSDPSAKSHQYFEFARPDVQQLVPNEAKSILDIGCGAGRLGMELKNASPRHVTGVEADGIAADRAQSRLDRVVNKSIEDVSEADLGFRRYDCIILADVLEHLRNPRQVLDRCRRWLTERGCIVVSIPNSRNQSVVRNLIEGNWTYEPAGLLDEDHVRCFTRREMEKLAFRCGLTVESQLIVPGEGSESLKSAFPTTLRLGRTEISDVTQQDAEELFAYQFVMRLRPAPRREYGMTSIVIVTWNELHVTRQCVESVLFRTDESFELIFVDNGSTDGTPDYLETVPNATVIRNSQNRGFAPSVNQGIAASSGDQILLLNNDCVVTTGWLTGLLEALMDRSENGLVGPVSNNVSGPQQIPITYNDLGGLDGFAWQQRTHRELSLTDRLVGFCLLVKREVIDRIGVLDERFEVGCFEDDDFCRRANDAGYQALIVRNVFVHHFGSVTFKAAGVDFAAVMRKNELKYREKWDAATPTNEESAACAHLPSVKYRQHQLPSGEILLQRKATVLSLCMIVRDNEDTIEACLNSIYPWVDELIIVDTGSTDRTKEICTQYGARMGEFPWCDDFSAARNESLRHASGEWLFWMDSDDVITEEQGRKLRRLVYGEHDSDCLGYVLQVHCPSSNDGEMTIVDHVKVFRNHPDLRFEHRIHEQILPAIRRFGGKVEFTDIHVVHQGSVQSAETRKRKLQRDFRILEQDLLERPDHPFVLFNMGMTYEDAGQYEEAVVHLRRCIEVSGSEESHVKKAHALLVNSLRQMGNADDAVAAADAALEVYPGDKELLFRRATLYQDCERHHEAIADYQRVLNDNTGRSFRSIDPAIVGHKAWHNLAISLLETNAAADAADAWQNAIADCQQFDTAWLSLGRLLAAPEETAGGESRRNGLSLEDLIQQAQSTPEISGTAVLPMLNGFLLERNSEIESAVAMLRAGWETTHDTVCLDEAARILTEAGRINDSLSFLVMLNEHRPHDAAVLHNLGCAFAASGNRNDAVRCLEESIRIRPNSEATKSELERIRSRMG